MSEFNIRPLERSDREWVAHFLDERWGTTQVVSRGKAVYGHLLPGFAAERVAPDETEAVEKTAEAEGKPNYLGLITINAEEKQCEIMTLDSLEQGIGVGTGLVHAVEAWAKESGIKRLWLVTTNDNLAALRFWQKRGYKLVMIHRNSIAESRRIKPQIPITGIDGIPILDEIELEKLL